MSEIGFLLKKTIAYFVEPFGMLIAIFAIGMYFLFRNKNSFAKFFLSLSFLVVFLYSYPPFSNYLVSNLENQYPKYDYKSSNIKYIHVLGSGHNTDADQPLSSQIGEASTKRDLEGIIIHFNTDGSKLIFTGYEGDTNIATAKMNEKLALALGVKKENMIINGLPKDTKEEAMGQHASFIVPGNERDVMDTVWQNLMTNQDVIHQVNENNTKSGQILLCEWYNTPLVDTNGKVIGAASLVEDITEKRKAELLSARMGRILEQSWNEIYTFDANTLHFIEASNGACQNLGYSMDELRQLTPVDLKLGFTTEQFETIIGPLRRGEKQTTTFEAEHQRKDGSCYAVEVRLQLSSIEMPPIFIAILQDISERTRTEQVLLDGQNKLNEAPHLAKMGSW